MSASTTQRREGAWRARTRVAARLLWVPTLLALALCYLNDLPFYFAGRDLITWLNSLLLIGLLGEGASATRWSDGPQGARGVVVLVAILIVGVFVIEQVTVRDYHALRPLWSSYGAMSDEAVARQWTEGNPYYPEESSLRDAAARVREREGANAAILYVGPHRGDVVNEPFYPTPVYMPPRLQFEALAAATLAWSSWRDPVFEAVRARRVAALGDVSNAGQELDALIRRHQLKWLVRIDPDDASKSQLLPLSSGKEATGS